MDNRERVEKLWELLDDIDTASDIFKPCESNGIKSFEKFYTYVMSKVAKRFDVLKSDGYKLYTDEEFNNLPKRSSKNKPLSINKS
jgi:hypothetical protein